MKQISTLFVLLLIVLFSIWLVLKKPKTIESKALASVKITLEGTSYELQPHQKKKDPDKVQQYFGLLEKLPKLTKPLERSESTEKNTEKNIEENAQQYGFTNSQTALDLNYEDGTSENITFGITNEYMKGRYIFFKERNKTALITEKLSAILLKEESFFQTKKLFLGKLQNISAITIVDNDERVRLQLHEERWLVNGSQADQEFVSGYIRDLVAAEMVEDLPDNLDKRQLGFVPAQKRVILKVSSAAQKTQKKQALVIGEEIYKDNKIIAYYGCVSECDDIITLLPKTVQQLMLTEQYFRIS